MSKLKQLQNNFTTQEQSKRLLEVGVPADSADGYYSFLNDAMRRLNEPTLYILQSQTILVGEHIEYCKQHLGINDVVPCWSVGRLMEVFDLITDGNNYISKYWDNYVSAKETSETYVDYIIGLFEENKEQLDFSKLEE